MKPGTTIEADWDVSGAAAGTGCICGAALEPNNDGCAGASGVGAIIDWSISGAGAGASSDG